VGPAGESDDDGRIVVPPRSHRAPVPMQESIRRLVPPLAAVTAIVLVIVLLLVLNRPGHTSSPDLAGPAVTSPSPSAPVVASTTPSASASARPSPSPHPTAAVAEPSATASPRVTRIAVTVLNNSRRTGLAADAAGQLSRGGWPIRAVGNFTGRIAVSTAYYAPGQSEVAHALARQFSAIQRVLPRFQGLPGSGLTLVVTREWPA